jgi:hypothetical protein
MYEMAQAGGHTDGQVEPSAFPAFPVQPAFVIQDEHPLDPILKYLARSQAHRWPILYTHVHYDEGE